MPPIQLLFAALAAAYFALRLFLALRQIRHVRLRANRVPAAFEPVISLESHRRAADYTVSKQKLTLAQIVCDAAVFVALTWGGGLLALGNAIQASWGDGIRADFAVVAATTFGLGLIDIPFDLWRAFRIDQNFGFNRSTLGLFLADLVKTTVLVAVIGAPVLWVVLYLMRHAGPWWWLQAWLVWSAVSLGLTVAFPLFIAPLFNRFTPLADGQLRDRIGALLRKTGFRDNGVFTMDGSRRSTHGNAYFTGLGSAKRIVFYDTLIERLRADEIEAVLAHELGHFRLNHIHQALVLSLISSLMVLALIGTLASNPGFFAALGVPLHPGAAVNGLLLVLVTLVLPQAGLLFAPLRSAWSRRHEFEADAFAARHANAEQLVNALVKLYQDNAATLTPDPWHSVFYDSHPPASERISKLLSGSDPERGAAPALAISS